MSYSISTTPTFEKQAKKLAKKYPSLKSDLLSLIEKLEENPTQGVELITNCYKVRIAIASKRKGKSGGARVITYVHIENLQVYLLSIFDKSEKETISDAEIKDILGRIE